MSDSRTQQQQVILLGASNVTRGLSTIVETARLFVGGPVAVHAAIGHGRSYGMPSRFLGRSIGGILQSHLWDAVSAKEGEAVRALVTDIGNDVMYGVPPEQIAIWVDTCVDRLQSLGACIVVTAPPMQRLERLRRWQYEVVRRVMFPTHRITFEQALQRAAELDRLIRDLASARRVQLVEPEEDWYGFDPIHIRLRERTTAWAKILGGWDPQVQENVRASRSFVRWARVRSMRPRDWRLLGLRLGSSQPGRLKDGSEIWLH